MFEYGTDDKVVAEGDEAQRHAVQEEEEAKSKGFSLLTL